jgi:hypothetical protein
VYRSENAVEFVKKIKDTQKEFRELQQKCGQNCYMVVAAITLVEIAPNVSDYHFTYSYVYGYDYSAKMFRELSDVHKFYDAIELARDSSVIINELHYSPTRCLSYDVSEFEERSLEHTYARFQDLSVHIDKVSICLAADRQEKDAWVLMLTFIDPEQSNCGSCIVELKKTRDSMEQRNNF